MENLRLPYSLLLRNASDPPVASRANGRYGEGEADTWLEVGSWAWNWMEPPLGQLSFALLCAQFARGSMLNLGSKPYGQWIDNFRANKLVRFFFVPDRPRRSYCTVKLPDPPSSRRR